MDRANEGLILIEDFLKGNLDKKNREIILRKLSLDDAFYQDFQLWVNLDDWLEELPAFEINQVLDMDVRETIPIYKRYPIVFSMACSILLLIYTGWYFYQKYDSVDKLTGQFSYTEINNPQNDQGMAGGDNTKPNITQQAFEASTYEQIDTTYQFSLQPFMLKVRMPKVSKKFGKNLHVVYDYNIDKYKMTLENQTFNIEESTEWKKLYLRAVK